MINYGEAISWSIKNGAVMRFVNRDSRPDFIMNDPSARRDGIALEMAADIQGQTVIAHLPLEFDREPSKAIALAVIGCVEFFLAKQSRVLSLN